MEALFDWALAHKKLLAGVGAASLFVFLASLVATPFLLARIPADYFAHAKAPASTFGGRHPLARLALRIARNLVGGLLILAGISMLVLPGQGLVTILIGLFALDFERKRAHELALLRRPPVLRTINWIRRRMGREPLRVFGVQHEETGSDRDGGRGGGA